MLADRHAAADHDDVGVERRARLPRVVAAGSSRHDLDAARARRPRARPAPAPSGRSSCGSPPGRSGSPGLVQLVAGGQHADPRPARARDRGAPDRGEHPELGGAELGAGREHASRRAAMSSPARRMSLAGLDLGPGPRPRPSPPSCPRPGHRVGALGDHRPGRDRDRLAGAERALGRVPGARLVDHGEPGRLSAGAPAVSAARTAKPSIAELSNPGTGSALVTSSASTRPSASPQRHRLVGRAARPAPAPGARASSISISFAAIGSSARLLLGDWVRERPGDRRSGAGGRAQPPDGGAEGARRARRAAADRARRRRSAPPGSSRSSSPSPTRRCPSSTAGCSASPRAAPSPHRACVSALERERRPRRRRDRLRHAARSREAARLARPARGAGRGLRGRRPPRAAARPLLAGGRRRARATRSTPARAMREAVAGARPVVIPEDRASPGSATRSGSSSTSTPPPTSSRRRSCSPTAAASRAGSDPADPRPRSGLPEGYCARKLAASSEPPVASPDP